MREKNSSGDGDTMANMQWLNTALHPFMAMSCLEAGGMRVDHDQEGNVSGHGPPDLRFGRQDELKP